MKSYLFTLIAFFVTLNGFSQGDSPCSATAITVNSLCMFATCDNTGFGDSGEEAPTCGFYGDAGKDVWFVLTIPASGNVTIDSDVGGITDACMAAYSGSDCSTLSEVDCDDDDGSGSMPMLVLTGLVSGDNLWIRFWDYGGDAVGTFDLCAFEQETILPATNDECADAIPLTVNPDDLCGVVTPGTVVGATASAEANGCAGTADDDVWFSFVAQETEHEVDILNISGSNFDMYHSVYEGPCGALTEISCNDGNNTSLSGLTPGQTYYVRVYTWTSTPGQTSTFDVCVGYVAPTCTDGVMNGDEEGIDCGGSNCAACPPPPPNDDCVDAIPLTVNPDDLCGVVTPGTVVGATASTEANGCAGTADDDVWFSFVAQETEHEVDILNISGSNFDMYHSVYEGTCGALTEISCNDGNNTSLTGLTPGQTYYVRVYTYTSNTGQTSTFDVCVGHIVPTCTDGIRNQGELYVDCGGPNCAPCPPPTVQDCDGAIPIQETFYELNAYSGTGNIPDEIDYSGPTCLLSGEKNDVWYIFNVTSDGVLDFSITPNDMQDDYDWAVFNITHEDCNQIRFVPDMEVSCNYAAEAGITGPNGDGDDNDEAVIPVFLGETYVINVSQYSTSVNGYTIDFSESTTSIFDEQIPVLDSVEETMPCASPQIPFYFDENIMCNTVEIEDFYIFGPGGPFVISSITSNTCASGGEYDNKFTLTIDPPLLPNQSYTIGIDTAASGSVSDMFGNVALPTSYTFISNNITLESFQSDLLCSGDSSGEASVEMVIPGSGNYTYTWSNSVVEGPVSSTTSLVVGLSSGNYTVTVTDEEGCQATRDFVIEEPQDILIDELVLSHVDVDFPGNPIGAFEVSVEGGTPVYEYSISGTDIWQSSSIFSDLIEGDYIVIVSDLNGCLDSINISIEDLSTSIGGFVSSNIEPSMLIYPNSISSDEAFVVKLMGFGKEKSVSVLFYDILGKKTFEQESVTDAKGFVKSEINQNIFESGIYLVIAYSNKKRCSSRLVIK